MLAFVDCGTICGTSSLAVTSTIGRETELQVEPSTRCTLCWWMKRLTLAMPLSGLHSSSRRMTSIFLPFTPPAALTASSSSLAIWPYFRPFSTTMRSVMPTRITPSCACAGAVISPVAKTAAGNSAKGEAIVKWVIGASSVWFPIRASSFIEPLVGARDGEAPSPRLRCRAIAFLCIASLCARDGIGVGPQQDPKPSRPSLKPGAPKPGSTQRIKRLDLLTLETGHVGFYGVPDFCLQIGQMAISHRKSLEQRSVEHNRSEEHTSELQ